MVKTQLIEKSDDWLVIISSIDRSTAMTQTTMQSLYYMQIFFLKKHFFSVYPGLRKPAMSNSKIPQKLNLLKSKFHRTVKGYHAGQVLSSLIGIPRIPTTKQSSPKVQVFTNFAASKSSHDGWSKAAMILSKLCAYTVCDGIVDLYTYSKKKTIEKLQQLHRRNEPSTRQANHKQ